MQIPLDGEALASLGFTPYFHRQWLTLIDEYPDGGVARVVCVRRGDYLISAGGEPRRAVLAGRLCDDDDSLHPCIGDFVVVDWGDGTGPGRVEHVFERTSLFQRKRPWVSSRAQPIAANVDRAIIVCALVPEDAEEGTDVAGRVLNVRRIERYLYAVAQAGVTPLVVVNKADLAADPGADTDALRNELGGVEVLAVSARTGQGIEVLQERLAPRETAVLVGSSGVGKSSLTNRLLGREVQRAEPIREADGRGRHTTTGRELFVLPGGALLIDTPGMRELGLYGDEGGALPITELVDVLARDCRFRDCRHEGEPGCAVRAAVERGDLSEARLDHARKLERELAWQRARQDAVLRSQESKKRRAFSRAARERQRAKGRT